MTHPFPYAAGTDVRRLADPARTDTVVEVHDDHAELRDGRLYAAHELTSDVLTDEQWLPLRGYEDRYRLSSHGKLLSLAYHRQPRQRLLKESHHRAEMTGTYKLPGLPGDPRPLLTVSAGQLVAAHFLPPPPNERPHHVRYLDGNRRNLRWDNLAWYDTTDTADEVVKAYLKRGRAYGQGNLVLSAAQAAEACALIDQKETPYKAIAARYGVSEDVIKALAKSSGLARARMSPAAQRGILAALRAGVPAGEIARQHNVHRNTIWRLAKLAGAPGPA